MNKLAKIVDEDKLVQFQKQDEFLGFINNSPPSQFIKRHPFADGVKYIPIDKVELMLDKIFQLWRVEVLDAGQLLNSIYVTARLHYRHPITGEMEFQDGIGAVAIQVEKGKNASQLEWIKSDAIMKGLPAAKSFAIKDAAEHIGKLFGRDINRKDTMGFTASYGEVDNPADVEKAKKAIKKATKREEFQTILAKLTPSQKLEVTPLINKRIQEVKDADTSKS